MTRSMTKGSPWKLILAFSLPLLLGNLFQQFYNIADAAIVGRTLGSEALAAVGSTFSIQFLVLGFCTGVTQGFAIPIAQRFGADDHDTMRKYVFGSYVLTAVCAIVITTLTVLLCPTILHILQVHPDIYHNAYIYIMIIFAGIPFTLLYNLLSAIMRAIGDAKTPFLFLAFSACLNIVLDLVCICNLHLGVAGAAIATITAQAVSGILCMFYMHRKVTAVQIHKEDRVMTAGLYPTLLVMGLPMGLQFSITAIGSMVMQSGNNSLGTTYVSGFTSGMRINLLMMCPFDALGAGVSTFLAQNYGSLAYDRIKQGFRSGILMALGYGITACIILTTCGYAMSSLFLSGNAVTVLNASSLYLFRIGLFYPILGILVITRMSIQGLGYSSKAMFGGMVEMIARTLVTLYLVPIFHYDAITWADQTAWVAAVSYFIPTYIHCLHIVKYKIQQEQLFTKA